MLHTATHIFTIATLFCGLYDTCCCSLKNCRRFKSIPAVSGEFVKKMKCVAILVFFASTLVFAQLYEEERCICACSRIDLQSRNMLYEAQDNETPPKDCYLYCDVVVKPLLEDTFNGSVLSYCNQCDCLYETRHTIFLLIVVVFLMAFLSILIVYLVCMPALKKLVQSRRRAITNHSLKKHVQSRRGAITNHSLKKLVQSRRRAITNHSLKKLVQSRRRAITNHSLKKLVQSRRRAINQSFSRGS